MKTCTGCGNTKPLEDFGRSKQSRDGRTPRCKTCLNAYARRYYTADITASRAQKRAYTAKRGEAHLAARRQSAKRWRANNPEKARQSATKSRHRLQETQPGYHRNWYQQNIDKERARMRKAMRELRQQQPEIERERKRRYRKRNAEAVRKREREKTYARRAKQPYSKELANLMAILVQQPCAYCGTTENITIDHIVPLSREGRHGASNLAPACFSCNSSKCDRLLSEWSGRFFK
jgi:5-methylcytosine-specific restriction endonuclease McrA